MSEQKQGWGQILPFVRSVDDLQRRAQTQRKGKQLIEASELLRRALEIEPDNERALLELAKVYTEAGYCELSNRVLLRLLRANPDNKECFYEIGINYYNLQAWAQAQDCLSMYVQSCPLGKNRKEANEIIMLLFMQQSSQVERRILRATQAYEAGKHNLAARLVKRAFSISPMDGDAYAVAAFLKLSTGDANGALELAKQALAQNGENTRALCAMVVALSMLGSDKAARKFLTSASEAAETETERIMVIHTACEVKAYDQALATLQALASESTPDPVLTHLTAVCLCQLDRQREALPIWAKMRRIDPDDTLADYYFTTLRDAIADGRSFRPSHVREVPLEETMRRLTLIRSVADDEPGKLRDAWRERDDIRRLVAWGLNQSEERIRSIMLGILRVAADEHAATILCEALLSTEHSDEFKQLMLEALFEMGKPGPHYMATSRGFSTAFIQVLDNTDGEGFVDERLHALVEKLKIDYGDVESTIINVWRTLLAEEGTVIETGAWIQALEYLVRDEMGDSPELSDRRVMRRVRRLKQIWDRNVNGVSSNDSDADVKARVPIDAFPTFEGWLDAQEAMRTDDKKKVKKDKKETTKKKTTKKDTAKKEITNKETIKKEIVKKESTKKDTAKKDTTKKDNTKTEKKITDKNKIETEPKKTKNKSAKSTSDNKDNLNNNNNNENISVINAVDGDASKPSRKKTASAAKTTTTRTRKKTETVQPEG